MTTTETKLPLLAEAMTAKDIAQWEDYLSEELGRGKVYFGCGSYGSGCTSWSCAPNWPHDNGRGFGWAQSWDEAIRAAQTWISNRPKVERNAVIRKLALAIIETKDEHGKVTVSLLRAKGFGPDEIALHAEACERAEDMCAGSPFIVEGAP